MPVKAHVSVRHMAATVKVFGKLGEDKSWVRVLSTLFGSKERVLALLGEVAARAEQYEVSLEDLGHIRGTVERA